MLAPLYPWLFGFLGHLLPKAIEFLLLFSTLNFFQPSLRGGFPPHPKDFSISHIKDHLSTFYKKRKFPFHLLMVLLPQLNYIYLETKGRSAMNRARLTALASLRWFFALVPVFFRDIMRACGLRNFFRSSTSL
jgi:hypothetical protein